MTQQNENDPGWWRRGMTQRGFTIVVAVCSAIIIAGIVFALVTGIPFF